MIVVSRKWHYIDIVLTQIQHPLLEIFIVMKVD